MARIESLNILMDPTGKDFLAELYGQVIANVQAATISMLLKNTDLSGNPESGTVEAKRFQNALSNEYGTARAAGKGAATKAKPVTVAIDMNKEIVEEIEEKDTALYGVDGLLQRRSVNHQLTLIRELERAFFQEGKDEGTAFTTAETDAAKITEAAIQQLETVKNAYVDGVPRDMMHIVASPRFYGLMRDHLDRLTNNANVNTAAESFTAFHGVRMDSSVYLPIGVDFEIMMRGSIAQPVKANAYNAEKIPLSEAYAVELFFYYGTKVVTPDLIFYKSA